MMDLLFLSIAFLTSWCECACSMMGHTIQWGATHEGSNPGLAKKKNSHALKIVQIKNWPTYIEPSCKKKLTCFENSTDQELAYVY